LLRGNHECRALTEHFTFREEVLDKYDIEVYDLIMDSFDMMPLVAIVGGAYLCMHGGISPNLGDIKEVGDINRFHEIPQEGVMTDLVWSDPLDE